MAGLMDSGKRGQWRRRMGRFQKGRAGVAEFCRREGVSEAAFYYWRKRLAEADEAETPGDGEPSCFMPVRMVGGASIEVRLPGGTQLLVPTADPQALRLAIEAVLHADARRAGGEAC